MKQNLFSVVAFGALGLMINYNAYAITVDPFYSASYTATSLGSVPGLPTRYGGLTFIDKDTVLIGGAANGASGRLYTIGVSRGNGNHISGFVGTASLYGGSATGIGDYNDGGVVFGPGGVLFTARWPINELGQTKPGSTDEDKVTNLGSLGIVPSPGAMNFVPAGFTGAGAAKLVSWSGGQWYDLTLAPDGNGTFDITAANQVDLDPVLPGVQIVPGGPEGFIYIQSGNPLFLTNSMLISEYSAGRIGAYELDANGNPLVATRRDFIVDLAGAEGAAIDPVTGDFLFSTFGGANQVALVQGFNTPPVPLPASIWLLGSGLFGLLGWRRFGSKGRKGLE